MKVRCLAMRHPPAAITFNQGLYFTTCRDCGVELVRERDMAWRKVPRGFRISWRAEGQHSLPPWRSLARTPGGLLREQALHVTRALRRRGGLQHERPEPLRLML